MARSKFQIMNQVVFIVGPTAVGKTKIAMALAKRAKGEIISADSMQIYRGMDIGTAKPSQLEQERVNFHLIDIKSPEKTYSAYEFRTVAVRRIRYLQQKKRLPIVVGGSGLYIKALLEGMSEHPGEDPKIRDRLYEEAKQNGVESLHHRLRKVDRKTAEKMDSHNLRRIVRALEVFECSGKSLSEWHGKQQTLKELGFEPFIFGITRDREALYEDIEKRVNTMFRKGLFYEARQLSKRRLSKTASQAVGYKEIFASLEGKHDLNTAKDLIKRNTRRLAKRQMTWFRRQAGVEWIELNKKMPPSKAADLILHRIKA